MLRSAIFVNMEYARHTRTEVRHCNVSSLWLDVGEGDTPSRDRSRQGNEVGKCGRLLACYRKIFSLKKEETKSSTLTSAKEEGRPQLVQEELSVVELESPQRLRPSQSRRCAIEALDVQVRGVAHANVQDGPDDGEGPARRLPGGSLERLVPQRIRAVLGGARDETGRDAQAQGQADGQNRVARNIDEERGWMSRIWSVFYIIMVLVAPLTKRHGWENEQDGERVLVRVGGCCAGPVAKLVL